MKVERRKRGLARQRSQIERVVELGDDTSKNAIPDGQRPGVGAPVEVEGAGAAGMTVSLVWGSSGFGRGSPSVSRGSTSTRGAHDESESPRIRKARRTPIEPRSVSRKVEGGRTHAFKSSRTS